LKEKKQGTVESLLFWLCALRQFYRFCFGLLTRKEQTRKQTYCIDKQQYKINSDTLMTERPAANTG